MQKFGGNGAIEADADLSAMAEHAQTASETLKSIANPHRLLILCVLLNGEQTVGELNQQVALSQSALSQHLAVLRTQNLVSTRREGQHVFYQVSPGLTVEIIEVLHRHFCD